jgi:hypothetical protein
MFTSYGEEEDQGDKEVILVNTVELAEGMAVSAIDWNSTGLLTSTIDSTYCICVYSM